MITYFNDSLGLKMTVPQVTREISRFIKEKEDGRYKIIIGTDSEASNNELIDFVTAVVVHRVGNGGRYFWRRSELNRFHTLRDRIIQEVLLSLEIAREILLSLKKSQVSRFDFEIHVDVGENGETKSMIQEVVGMVRAYNFEARTKPESYVASKVADRYV